MVMGCDFLEVFSILFTLSSATFAAVPTWHREALHCAGTPGLVACEVFPWHAMGHVQPHLACTVPGMNP